MRKHRKAVDTRELYCFESIWLQKYVKDTRIHKLRELSQRIWRYYSKGSPIPVIVAGSGTNHQGLLFSYYCPKDHKIVLSRNQRNPIVMIHELTHALLHKYPSENHGSRFKLLYFKLLLRYTTIPKNKLKLAIKEHFG